MALTITPGQRVVIAVPGYKGSELVDRAGRVVWVDAYEALLGRKSLAISTDALPIADALDLRAGRILKRVSLRPLYTYPVYEEWLLEMKELAGGNVLVHPFAYDWRRDIEVNVSLLSSEIQKLREAGAGSVVLAGHSMGALIVAYYARYGGSPIDSAEESWTGVDSIDAAILFAGPFRGSAVMFRDMQTGVRTALNKSLLDSFSLSTFPSSYQLLPASSEPILQRDSGETLSIFDAKDWRLRGWGLFRDRARAGAPDESTMERFVNRMLERSEKLSKLLNAPLSAPSRRKIPILSVNAAGLPTPRSFDWPEKQGRREETEIFAANPGERTIHESGDGVVLAASSELPEAYRKALRATEVEVESDHLGILGDRTARETMRDFFALLESTRDVSGSPP